MILETKEEIHQWLKEQCPVYVRWLGDDLNKLIDYVFTCTFKYSDDETLADLTHLSHGRMMTQKSEPFHGIVSCKYYRGRVDCSEYVIYFRNQKDEEEKIVFAENGGKNDFDKAVAFYSTPTTLDTAFYEKNMADEKEREIRRLFKAMHASDKKIQKKTRRKKRHRRGVWF